MSASFASNCLTRVVVDDEHEVTIAQLQLVMQRIQQSLLNIPAIQREYIANALLNLAVARMLKEGGANHAAGILTRLGEAVSECGQPASVQLADHNRMHA